MCVEDTISIIIASCDRVDALTQTLRAIEKIRFPSNIKVELIVVDNSKSGSARDVVNDQLTNQCTVLYISEPTPGKSNALNAACRIAGGKVLLFTDDDVRPPKDWIEKMCDPILSGGADAVAGWARLASHLDLPWMTTKHRGYLADTRHWSAETNDFLVGINMAVSREAFDQVGGFNPLLGPGAPRYGMNEDTRLAIQLKAAGYRIVNQPDSVVEHHPQSSRLGRASWIARCRVEGRSHAYMYFQFGGSRGRRSLLLMPALIAETAIDGSISKLRRLFRRAELPVSEKQLDLWYRTALNTELIRLTCLAPFGRVPQS